MSDDDNRHGVASTSDKRLAGLRRFVAARYTTIVVALVVLLLIGGAFTATTLAGPDTEGDQERVVWTDSGEFTHSAVVQNDTEAFEQGDVLENRGTYFTRVSPELDVEYEYRHETANGTVDVETELLLILQSSDGEEVYWELTESLDSEQSASIAAGDSHTVASSVDVSDLQERVERIQENLGADPGETDARIVARSEIEGTVENQSVSHVREDVLVITPDGETYSVDTTMDDTGFGDRSETVAGTAERSSLRTLGAPLLFVVSLVGLVGVVGAEKRGHLQIPADTRHHADRRKFDDWITTGSLPASLADQPTIEVDSLEGLVDVAIDSDRRVIEDSSAECYYVTEDSILYKYEPAADSAGTQEDGSDSEGDRDEESDPAA
ncbi:DUF5305 domain-containing protein [Natronoarchaeum sp. GCM10025321]